MYVLSYGVATIRRLLKITGLFCRRALEKRGYSAKETYIFKEPTNRSHPINDLSILLICVWAFCRAMLMAAHTQKDVNICIMLLYRIINELSILSLFFWTFCRAPLAAAALCAVHD